MFIFAIKFIKLWLYNGGEIMRRCLKVNLIGKYIVLLLCYINNRKKRRNPMNIYII